MKVSFVETDVDLLPFEALQYLNQAVESTPGNDTNIWKALSSGGRAFLIKDETELVGAIYLEFYPEILNIVLFGISDIHQYKLFVSDFIKKSMRDRNLKNLFIISRIGWHRIFTELKPLGMFYSYQDGGVCGGA